MRRIFFAVLFTASAVLAEDPAGPTTNLKEYQNRALEHLWTKPAPETKAFDLQTLPMEKILTAAAVKERGCAIPLHPIKPGLTLDTDLRKATPPAGFTEKMPQLRGLPVCSSKD